LHTAGTNALPAGGLKYPPRNTRKKCRTILIHGKHRDIFHHPIHIFPAFAIIDACMILCIGHSILYTYSYVRWIWKKSVYTSNNLLWVFFFFFFCDPPLFFVSLRITYNTPRPMHTDCTRPVCEEKGLLLRYKISWGFMLRMCFCYYTSAHNIAFTCSAVV